MLNLTIPEAKDVIVGELARRGEWITANVETTSPWPLKAQKVIYRGEVIWVLPVMKDRYPSVSIMRRAGKSRSECERLLLKFLSAVAWVERAGFLVDGFSGSTLPSPLGRRKESGFSLCDTFDLIYLPEPSCDKASLALALMREGRGLNHAGYSFLSFYRVVELAIGRNSRSQRDWIDAEVAKGLGHFANDALNKLKAQNVTNIGQHLYESGRCAVAHASGAPIIDPDNPEDTRRLWSERPIMMELAERAIERVLGIETRHTVWEKHLYELEGFKKILSSKIVDSLVRGVYPEESSVDMPNISIKIRDREAYAPFENLTIKEIGSKDHVVTMVYASENGLSKFRFRLDFANERLNFDIFSDFRQFDDGSVESAEALAEGARFFADYFGNGQLFIRNAETNELLSRKDAFLPKNSFVDYDGTRALIAEWKQAAANRRNLNMCFANDILRHGVGYDIKVNSGRVLSAR
jgi:hypothetical protein